MECMSQDDIGGRQPVTTDAIMFEPLAPAPHAIVVDPGADALPKAAVRLDVNATDENRNFVMTGRKADTMVGVLTRVSRRLKPSQRHREVFGRDVDVDVRHRTQLRPVVQAMPVVGALEEEKPVGPEDAQQFQRRRAAELVPLAVERGERSKARLCGEDLRREVGIFHQERKQLLQIGERDERVDVSIRTRRPLAGRPEPTNERPELTRNPRHSAAVFGGGVTTAAFGVGRRKSRAIVSNGYKNWATSVSFMGLPANPYTVGDGRFLSAVPNKSSQKEKMAEKLWFATAMSVEWWMR